MLKLSIDKTNTDLTSSYLLFEARCSYAHFLTHVFLQFYLRKFVMRDCNSSWQEAIFHTCI